MSATLGRPPFDVSPAAMDWIVASERQGMPRVRIAARLARRGVPPTICLDAPASKDERVTLETVRSILRRKTRKAAKP